MVDDYGPGVSVELLGDLRTETVVDLAYRDVQHPVARELHDVQHVLQAVRRRPAYTDEGSQPDQRPDAASVSPYVAALGLVHDDLHSGCADPGKALRASHARTGACPAGSSDESVCPRLYGAGAGLHTLLRRPNIRYPERKAAEPLLDNPAIDPAHSLVARHGPYGGSREPKRHPCARPVTLGRRAVTADPS
jgi:hypothetical protein